MKKGYKKSQYRIYKNRSCTTKIWIKHEKNKKKIKVFFEHKTKEEYRMKEQMYIWVSKNRIYNLLLKLPIVLKKPKSKIE